VPLYMDIHRNIEGLTAGLTADEIIEVQEGS
jgi:hypothetical protein